QLSFKLLRQQDTKLPQQRPQRWILSRPCPQFSLVEVPQAFQRFEQSDPRSAGVLSVLGSLFELNDAGRPLIEVLRDKLLREAFDQASSVLAGAACVAESIGRHKVSPLKQPRVPSRSPELLRTSRSRPQPPASCAARCGPK